MKKDTRSKLQKHYDKHKELHRKLRQHAADILSSEKFKSTREYMQHGTIPVHRHCIDVAKQSLIISRLFHIPVNEKEMVRGALLHDYFLYDWHDKTREGYKPWHGFYHPGVALKNADRDYDLTMREKDIIKKHMWPMTIIPPVCREAWIVSVADKWCSTAETLRLKKGAVKQKSRSGKSPGR